MKQSSIRILAGPKAYREIKEQGLNADRIRLIVGASGGPKWLALSRLDQYLNQHFLSSSTQAIALLGSSVGAWRMALYATSDAHIAFKELEAINMTQRYSNPIRAKEVQGFVDNVLTKIFTEKRRLEIIQNTRRHLHIISVRNRQYLNSRNIAVQFGSLSLAALGNIITPSAVPKIYPRVIVSKLGVDNAHGKKAEIIPLNKVNLPEALIASGTIPMIMQPTKITGGKDRWYWDGALTDYHFGGPFKVSDGLILYPHFSSKIVPGWFDKPLPWRKPTLENYSNVVMLVPSASFIENLPYRKIPDRKDFERLSDSEREHYWNIVLDETDRLVAALHSALASDKCRAITEPIIHK
ncbi:alpha/beta superfamily hydrolase [Oleiphilus messinensis]|uniref:Alpha/beta superfamily hydrolase n=1 Tax=Oleiphilus messinensis TaxID=141451 RepID=A0A1Y0IAU1_9GAMM|nr:patatin-like phospholipase family protein [Oleiphilus messinensis]ARU56513.1 alpha/beta superfamily hydrolase [Oleiphilus messinensis]